ncbi:MAG: START domain-containing protein [Pseudomonadales bacterium]|nr:START domain-containing protein [Pseudomonadales bacterium]
MLTLLWLSLAAAAGAAEAGWTVRRDADGIEVSTRSAPDSPHAEVRARMRLEAPLAAVVALLRDKAAAPEWIAYCEESYVLETPSATEDVTYTWNAMPWPVRDRELVMRVRWSRDPATGAVRMEAEAQAEGGPHVPGRVRITDARTGWTLQPTSDDHIDVEFRSHLDPASPIPAWLLNRLLVNAPHQTLARMRDLLAEGRYRSAELEFLAGAADAAEP